MNRGSLDWFSVIVLNETVDISTDNVCTHHLSALNHLKSDSKKESSACRGLDTEHHHHVQALTITSYLCLRPFLTETQLSASSHVQASDVHRYKYTPSSYFGKVQDLDSKERGKTHVCFPQWRSKQSASPLDAYNNWTPDPYWRWGWRCLVRHCESVIQTEKVTTKGRTKGGSLSCEDRCCRESVNKRTQNLMLQLNIYISLPRWPILGYWKIAVVNNIMQQFSLP